MLKPYSPAHHPQKTNANRRRYRTQWPTHLLDGQGRHVWITVKTWKLAAEIIPSRSGFSCKQSAQATSTDRHKQDFSILVLTLNHKVKKISCLLPQISPSPTLHFQGTSFFSSSCKILRRNFQSLRTRFIYLILFKQFFNVDIYNR